VVTLVPQPGAVCWGMAYRVASYVWDAVLDRLDERESGGFERLDVEVTFADRGRLPVRGLVYVAADDNPNFLGPASLPEMAGQVRCSRGRSGTNAEYVLRLAGALRELGVEDEHVFDLAAELGEARER
jgi:cation transport regulator ChaC